MQHTVNIQNLPARDPAHGVEASGDGHVAFLLQNGLRAKREQFDADRVYFTNATCGDGADGHCLEDRRGNALVTAVLHAYNNHQDLVLSPNDIWNVVLLALSKHVNDNAERLRGQFVSHENQIGLTIVDVASSTASSLRMEKNWTEYKFFPRMLKEIQRMTIDGVVDLLRPDFSSTSPADEIFSIATVMDSFQQYFTYTRMISRCGINNVRFMGTLEDWQKLRQKTAELIKYSVLGPFDTWTTYVERVVTILDKFVETYQGTVDLEFWNTIVATEAVRRQSGRGLANIEGWILHFLGIYTKIDIDKIPEKTISVPITLINQVTDEEKLLTLLGGFSGVQYKDGAYRPQLGLVLYEFRN